MPFDIVGEIAHIDATVLLGRLAHGLHHLFFGDGAIFKGSGRGRVAAAAGVTGSRMGTGNTGGGAHGRARTAIGATVVVARARARAGGVGAAAASRTARTTTGGARPLALSVVSIVEVGRHRQRREEGREEVIEERRVGGVVEKGVMAEKEMMKRLGLGERQEREG